MEEFVCRIMDSPWKEHVLRHCSHVNLRDGVFHCGFARCAGRQHNSLKALKIHVELSHLSRVAVRCPVHDCKEAFIRVQQLVGHFERAHRELFGTRVPVDAFAPLATPAPPRHLRRLPPLPKTGAQMNLSLLPVSIPPIHQGQSQASASQSLSRKWSRLNVPDDESNEDPISFDDLPTFSYDALSPPVVDVEVRQQLPPSSRQSLLSRPQPVVYPRARSEEPQGHLYQTFVTMVEKKVADGTLSAHGERAM